MAPLTQLDAFRFPTTAVALCTLRVRVDDLARRIGFRIESWEEDGLGPAHGAALRLPSGRPLVLQELQYALAAGASSGPDVWVDEADLRALGVEAFLNEILAALDLSRDAIAWTQSADIQIEADRPSRRTDPR